MDDRHFMKDVLNGIHFVVRHFRFSLEAFKQMKFLIDLDFLFEYFIQSDEQLCTVSNCNENTYNFFDQLRPFPFQRQKPFLNEISKLTKT